MEAEVGVILLEREHKPRKKGKPVESGKGEKQILPWSFQKKYSHADT